MMSDILQKELYQQKAPLPQKGVSSEDTIPSIDDWQPLPVFLEKHPQFSEQQLRWLLFHRKTNGLDQYVQKIGKPLYINVPGFTRWIFKRTQQTED